MTPMDITIHQSYLPQDDPDAAAGMPSCVAKQVTRPVRNREAPAPEPHLN